MRLSVHTGPGQSPAPPKDSVLKSAPEAQQPAPREGPPEESGLEPQGEDGGRTWHVTDAPVGGSARTAWPQEPGRGADPGPQPCQ